jgi:DNA-binding response OmpR family regulator
MNLRILFVEDSPDDVELMLRRLREAGIEPQWDRVETEAALREALAGERWELALVDYNLPGFGGLEALAVLAAEAPDVPAITVSGAITEETAVATITAGAVDYVLKDNLTRLAPAARRAVEGAALRRQERRAAAQARQTMYAIEHSSQAIVYVSEDGTVLYANAAAQRLGGVSPAEVIGQEIWGWSPAVDETRWGELWRAAAQHPIVELRRPLDLALVEVLALERAVEALDHAIGLRRVLARPSADILPTRLLTTAEHGLARSSIEPAQKPGLCSTISRG